MAKTTQLRDLAVGFSCLSDPTRLAILRMLARGPSVVTAMAKALDVPGPLLSYHLGLLRTGRLVERVRQGQSMRYETDAAALKQLADALADLRPRR